MGMAGLGEELGAVPCSPAAPSEAVLVAMLCVGRAQGILVGLGKIWRRGRVVAGSSLRTAGRNQGLDAKAEAAP